MNLLSHRSGRRVLFTALYFSEGAPIGFLWWALPTRLRAAGLEVEQITGLTALLVLPWTCKFLWAPLVDSLHTRRWTLRHWILVSQCLMLLTLLPLAWLDVRADFVWLRGTLLLHALAAATQDVAIDALCIRCTEPQERGRLNGWMQAGMLLARSLLGGGALVLAAKLGDLAVLVLLLAAISGPALLLLMAGKLPVPAANTGSLPAALGRSLRGLARAAETPASWFGLAFALVGGAAFEGLGAVQGPLLIDHGFTAEEVGWLLAGPLVACLIAGSLGGGWAADRVGHRRSTLLGQLLIVATVLVLALRLTLGPTGRDSTLLVLLCLAAGGIGFYTAASYALLMDLTRPEVAGTQFSAFMGATNGCEAWSAMLIGRLAGTAGYPSGLLLLAAVSAASLLLLPGLRRPAQ